MYSKMYYIYKFTPWSNFLNQTEKQTIFLLFQPVVSIDLGFIKNNQ